MKHLKSLVLALVLAFAMTTSALAAEVPDNLVVENLNGQQRIVKTYVLPPEKDPETLKEPSFDYDGFTYTWAFTTKDEHAFLESKSVTETVTVETASNNLDKILAELAPSVPYDDGEYSGELALDHTTISTVAADYTTQYGTVTATKTIGPVDRNDMSYVPATTVKNGMTLKLSGVTWQVTGTDLVGDTLAPASYQAVATYSASTSSKVATGYVTTAEYKGEVTASGVDSITYTVVYVGEETTPAAISGSAAAATPRRIITAVLCLIPLLLLAGLGVFLFQRRKNVYVYVPGDRPRDYRLVAKYRVEPEKPEIDISDLEPYPEGIVAVEIKRPLAKKLLGQNFTVRHRTACCTYTVLQDRPGDWREFDLTKEKEEVT
ncbi:hypothetical protein [uncultured Oscillibacter sp.]|uniref:hypothetical protein n=1 Tax=uncultured Oscillibacter sp. TaxID=876091 RepID=UPI00266FA7AB|nr:hypothetical protein [uncultured Oscillibacter sp.]